MSALRCSPVGPGPHRELGEEMIAEGWIVIGDDHIMWMHPPSKRAVVVDDIQRGQTTDPPLTEVDARAPADADGYIVACSRFDDFGNPGECDSFWTASYTEAVKRARAIRRSILDERKPVDASVQMTLDDVLGKGGGTR